MGKISQIHFIEDSDDEIFLAKLLLETQRVSIDIVHHEDFGAFDDYLEKHGPLVGGLVLVDMNLPGTRGDILIKKLLERDDLKATDIGMCSGSEDPADLKAALDAGSRFFVQKPLDLICLKNICDTISGLQIQENEKGEFCLVRL